MMDMTFVPVSFLMPAYNCEKYIAAAIDSILTQTFTDFELVIINDGSTDNTENIILSVRDERIRYYRNDKNLGVVNTLNKGIQLCRGKYIARMDADDIALPARLYKQYHFMEQHPEIGLCGTWMDTIGNDRLKLHHPADHESIVKGFLFENPIAHPTVIIRKSVLDKHQLSYPHGYDAAEDYKMWVMMAGKTQVANIPEVLLHYRLHDEQIKSKKITTQIAVTNLVQQEIIFDACPFLSEEEKQTVRTFGSNGYTDISNVDKVLERIFLCSREDFFRYLFSQWLHVFYQIPEYNLKTYTKVTRLFFYKHLPPKQKAAFLAKCVLKRSKNTV